jgi:hypothetical protein
MPPGMNAAHTRWQKWQEWISAIRCEAYELNKLPPRVPKGDSETRLQPKSDVLIKQPVVNQRSVPSFLTEYFLGRKVL